MHKKGYQVLAFVNFVFGVCAICLYLPYTITAFNLKGFAWLDFAETALKNNYYNTLIYFGVFLLIWFIMLNVLSLFSHINLPKFIFKISTISALILPLIYTLALKNNSVLDFWIKNIAPNIKTMSYILLCISCGSFILGLVFNFTKDNKANIHNITEALVMSMVIILLCIINNWCGFNVASVDKLFGVLMALFAVYLPISSIILIICAKNRL